MSDTKKTELDALREKLLYKNKNAFTGDVNLCLMQEKQNAFACVKQSGLPRWRALCRTHAI